MFCSRILWYIGGLGRVMSFICDKSLKPTLSPPSPHLVQFLVPLILPFCHSNLWIIKRNQNLLLTNTINYKSWHKVSSPLTQCTSLQIKIDP